MEDQIRQSNRELIALSRLPGTESTNYLDDRNLTLEAQELLRRMTNATQHFASSQAALQEATGNFNGENNRVNARHHIVSPHRSAAAALQLREPSLQNSSHINNHVYVSQSSVSPMDNHKGLDYRMNEINRFRNLQMISPTEDGPTSSKLFKPEQVPQHDAVFRNTNLNGSNLYSTNNLNLPTAVHTDSRGILESRLTSMNPSVSSAMTNSASTAGLDPVQALVNSLQTSYLNQLLLPHILAAQALSTATPPSFPAHIPQMPPLIPAASSPTSSATPGINQLALNPALAALLMQQNPLLLPALIAQQSAKNLNQMKPTNENDSQQLTILPGNTVHSPSASSMHLKLESQQPPNSPLQVIPNTAQIKAESGSASMYHKSYLKIPQVPPPTTSNKEVADTLIPRVEKNASELHEGLLVPANHIQSVAESVKERNFPQTCERRVHSKVNTDAPVAAGTTEKDTLVAIIQKSIMGQLHNTRKDSMTLTNSILNEPLKEDLSNRKPTASASSQMDIQVLGSSAQIDPIASISEPSSNDSSESVSRNECGSNITIKTEKLDKKHIRKRRHRARETVSASEIFNDDSSRSGNNSPLSSLNSGGGAHGISRSPLVGSPLPARDELSSATSGTSLISALAADNGQQVSEILLKRASQPALDAQQEVGVGGSVPNGSKHVNLKKNWAVQYQKQESVSGDEQKVNSQCEDAPTNGNKKMKITTPIDSMNNGALTNSAMMAVGGKNGGRRSSRETIAVSEIFSSNKDPNNINSSNPVASYQKIQTSSPPDSSSYAKGLELIGSYLQTDTCCVITPKPNLMCRDCRARGTNTPSNLASQKNQLAKNSSASGGGKTYCRFDNFRKLKNSKNKYPSVVGFLEADRDAMESDLALWECLQTSYEKMFSPQVFAACNSLKGRSHPDKAIFRVEQVGSFLCSIVYREQVVQKAYTESIYWKRFVSGCRELCDVCSTSLFNFHWLCPKCGFVTCLDCYESYLDSNLEKGVLGTAETQQDKLGRVWLRCTKMPHVKESLKLTQFIPSKCVDKLINDLHEQCRRWRIDHHCQMLQSFSESGKVSVDYNPITSSSAAQGQNCKKPASPLCGVTSTSSPSPPAVAPPPLIPQLPCQVPEREEDIDNVEQGSLVIDEDNKNANKDHSVISNDHDSCLKDKAEAILSNKSEVAIAAGSEKSNNEVATAVGEDQKLLNGATLPKNPGGMKKERSINLFIDKLVESSYNNSDKIEQEILMNKSTKDYGIEHIVSSSDVESCLKFVQLCSPMPIKVPKNWEIGFRGSNNNDDDDDDCEEKWCEKQPSSSSDEKLNVSDNVAWLSKNVKRIDSGGADGIGSILRLDTKTISPIEQAMFSVEWRLNKPVIVSGCGLENQKLKEFFSPDYLSQQYGDWKVDLIDCRTGRVHPMMSMEKFLHGFTSLQSRRTHFGQLSNGCNVDTVLKLKDWPPGSDFTDVMPVQSYEILMESIPFHDYTKRSKGGSAFNLATSLPPQGCVPDMGPKMFIAYGSPNEPNVSSTNLHIDMSDAVNILLHVCEPAPLSSKLPPVAPHNNPDSLLDEVREFGGEEAVARFVKGEKPGAVWNVFNTKDIKALRKFLRNEAEIVHKAYRSDDDPIHDQDVFLNPEKLSKLKLEEGIEPFTFVQFENDCVFIPSGAPHQVRNLNCCIKAAVDFVSPERVEFCLTTTEEFRNLSDRHSNHEDKLQIKSVIYHSVKDSISVLKHLNN